MRGVALVGLLVVAILIGSSVGYFIGTANERAMQNTTRTVITTTTIIRETPILVESVETGNVSIGGSAYTYALAVNPNASRIYVTDRSNVLTVVDAASHTVVASVTLPSASSGGIAIDYKTGTVYVLVNGGVAVVNGTSNTVIKMLANDFSFMSLAFDSSTDTLYGSPETIYSGNISGYLVGIDARSGAVTGKVSIGYWASSVLVNPRLNLIYGVGCSQSELVCGSAISVVNGTDNTLMNKTALGSAYYATATVDEKSGWVYVSGEDQLAKLNPYGTVIYNHYPETCGPFIGMADDPAMNQIILAPQDYNYVLVYGGSFGNLLNMYSLPDSPQRIAFNPVTDETYVIVSESLLSFKGVASTGNANDTLIGAGQQCLPP